MRLNFPFIFLLFLLVSALCFMQACSDKEKNKTSARRKMVDDPKTALVSRLSVIAKKINNEQIDTTVQFENYITGEKRNFSQLVKTGSKFIFQYSELNCDLCVDSALSNYKKFASTRNSWRFVIVVESDNRRYVANFIRENSLRKFNVYLLSTTDFRRFYSVDPGVPFVYIADSTMKIKNAFVPAREYPAISEAYYNRLSVTRFLNSY